MTTPAVHPPRHGQPFEDNPALTIADMARELNCDQAAIRLWIKAGDIQPAYRRDSQNHYWYSDVVVADREHKIACARRFLTAIGRHADE